MSCERIFSSSLHGIIIAQAYGIPAQWIEINNKPIHYNAEHKFEDYFLGGNQIVQKPLKLNLSQIDINVLRDIPIPAVMPFKGKERLMSAFPFDIFAKNIKP